MTEEKVKMLLEKIDGEFVLFACRGEGKGCKRNGFRASQKHCDDCIRLDNLDETLGELVDRMKRGDA